MTTVVCGSWLVARAALVLALATTGAAQVGEAQYLAVFVDGRILPVQAARLVEPSRIRFEFTGGGHLEVPLSRLDRVIEDVVEPNPAPITAPPQCRIGFVDEPLPAGTRFGSEIRAAARSADLHPRLVAAVVAAESGFQPYAVSRVGACGLMQLMPSVWLAAGISSPYLPGENLKAGSAYLRKLVDRFGDPALALAAYNAGAAVVERNKGLPPYRETREFVRRVLSDFCPNAGVTLTNPVVGAKKPV